MKLIKKIYLKEFDSEVLSNSALDGISNKVYLVQDTYLKKSILKLHKNKDDGYSRSQDPFKKNEKFIYKIFQLNSESKKLNPRNSIIESPNYSHWILLHRKIHSKHNFD